MSQQPGRRKELTGVVTSDKMAKTVVVRVTRLARHPTYEKVMRHYVHYKVHDEESKAKTGDTVRIVETRPLSKDKRWKVVGIISKLKQETDA
jgi:small subunit ribosomal protein S17